ncbi:MAG: hypothetical protein E7A62_05005 [Actinomycetaceae bacterium]|nr:hypothetical protein [Actinomycetaceae bacterium]MDU0970342.1 hypothetical protein [Actinomycetaceae bacterium]
MDTGTLIVHILAVLVILAIIVLLIVGLVREKKAHKADVKRLEEQIEALKHQNAAWQDAAHN